MDRSEHITTATNNVKIVQTYYFISKRKWWPSPLVDSCINLYVLLFTNNEWIDANLQNNKSLTFFTSTLQEGLAFYHTTISKMKFFNLLLLTIIS